MSFEQSQIVMDHAKLVQNVQEMAQVFLRLRASVFEMNMLCSVKPFPLLVFFSTLSQLHAQAPDQTANDASIDEVVVTAQRRSENLQDVALSVTAVTGDELRRAAIRDSLSIAGLHFE